MNVKYTLTTEMPTWCLGLWDSYEEAEKFLEEQGMKKQGVSVTPVFIS